MRVELFCGVGDLPGVTPYLSTIVRLEQECYGNPWPEEEIISTLSYDYNLLLLAFLEDDAPVGFLIANLLMEQSELLRITVDPAHRRKGVGGRLLAAYLSEISGMCESALLEVREGNEPARRLYESFGYQRISTRKGYYRNPSEDALIYMKEIREPIYTGQP